MLFYFMLKVFSLTFLMLLKCDFLLFYKLFQCKSLKKTSYFCVFLKQRPFPNRIPNFSHKAFDLDDIVSGESIKFKRQFSWISATS